MDNFIAVHTLEMEPVLVRAGAIAYVTEIDGSAQIFFSGDSDKAIPCHESLADISHLINEEMSANINQFK